MQILLEEQGVEVVNAETVLHRYPATIAGAWPLKPYAIAHSRFREVLSLDADTVPLADPAAILDWDLYRESGLLFWPDVIDLLETNPIWSNLGLEPRNCISVEFECARYRQGARLGRSRYRHPAQRALARVL